LYCGLEAAPDGGFGRNRAGSKGGHKEAIVTLSGSPSVPGRDHQADVIDKQHLAGVTLGDASLEREVLELFLRQAALMLGRIGRAPATVAAAAAAHTLKGSARGIGLWRLVRAAESFEQAVANAGEDRIKDALSELTAAGLEASAAISAHLDRSFADRTRGR
jgi:HPt (histidine-containing phosphotransfer) domain-containing protein